MAENDPTSPPPEAAPPSSDLQLPPASTGGVSATVPPDAVVPERSLVQKPRWPHPSFGWSLLWCLLFWITMQVPGAIVVVLVLVALAILSPDKLPLKSLSDPQELLKTDAMNLALGLGQSFAEILSIAFAWLVIRLVVGKDWTRQLAIRRPGLVHTLLVLASLPVMALFANIAYALVRESGWVPSISDSNPLNVFYFWTSVFVVLCAAVLVSWLLAGFGWTQRLAARPAQPVDILAAAIIVPVLVLCILALYHWLHLALRAPGLENMKIGGMEEMTKIFDKWQLGFAVLVIGLGPGIGEELWCRGFLGRGLVGSHGAVVGVLASSFLFGLIHTDPCQGAMAMLAGLWLHFVYLTTRTLLLPMLLHFLNNSLSVVGSRSSALQLLDAKPQDIPILVYVSGLLLLVGVAYALYQSRSRLAARLPEQFLVWRPTFQGVEYPSEYSNMRVVHPLPSLTAVLLAGGAFALFVGACVSWFSGS